MNDQHQQRFPSEVDHQSLAIPANAPTMSNSQNSSSHITLRSASTSFVRPKRAVSAGPHPKIKSKMNAEKEEEDRRAMADAAFNEWLIRKNKLPKGPRYSPSRDQIAEHLREDERHRVFNLWLAKPWWPRKATASMHFAVRNSFRLRRAHSVEPTFMTTSTDAPRIRNLYDA